jgi:hypothetical protein
MSEPHVITALVDKRAELAGDIVTLDKQRRSIRAKIAHVDQTLKLFGYEGDPSDIAPRVRYQRLFRRGELTRMMFDILREARSAMTNKEIAAEVIRRKGWEGDDLVARITDSVKAARRKM